MDLPDDAQLTVSALHKAHTCKNRGNDLFKQEQYESAAKEYFDGIIHLTKAQRNAEILDLVTTLRSNRSACYLQLARDGKESAQIISWATEATRDATAVLDLPKHASEVLMLKARLRRASALSLMLQHGDGAGQAGQASADAADVICSSLATKEQAKQAEQIQQKLQQLQQRHGSSSDGASIHGAFLTHDLLMRPASLRVGRGPAISIAKSFMDKRGPVNMTDGTPKDGAENARAVEALDQVLVVARKCDKAEWQSTGRQMILSAIEQLFGKGAGTYLGEILFWRLRRGEMLGKQKWETNVYLQHDVGTLGELWDMRWVFPSADNAYDFHLDMIAASRAEGGTGYLEGPECHEVPLPKDLSASRLTEPVLFANRPRKLPKNIMRSHEVMSSPVEFTHQYGVVFCVDRVVIKLMASSGLCATHTLNCAALVDLAEVAAARTSSWLNPDQNETLPQQRQQQPRPSPRVGRTTLPSVGLHNVSPTEAFVRSFHTHAAALRNSEPWEMLGLRHHTFLLGAAHLGASKYVVQLLGSSGRHRGVQIWPTFKSFIKNKRSGALPEGLLIVSFLDPLGDAAELLAEDVRLAHRHGAKAASVDDSLRRVFPMLQRGENECQKPLRMVDARIAEAAMAMAVQFFAKQVCAKPVPPLPHPICYTFEPCTASLSYASGSGGDEEAMFECSPQFPAGDFATRDWPWSSYPQSVSSEAKRPASVFTIGQAIDFHRSALATLGPLIRCRVRVHGESAQPQLNGAIGTALSYTDSGRYLVQLTAAPASTSALVSVRASSVQLVEQPSEEPATERWREQDISASERWRAHTFGLANALWELETIEDVQEACRLGERLLADRQDLDVATFLLDLYLELGWWDCALGLLHRVKPSCVGAEMQAMSLRVTCAWTAALIRIKKHGADSDKAAKAVQLAIGVNANVFPMLVRDIQMPERESISSGPYPIRQLKDGTILSPEADEAVAASYMLNFRKHWWVATPTADSVLCAVRRAGDEAYRDACERPSALLAAANMGHDAGQTPTVTLPTIPKQLESVCAHCRCVCNAKLCNGCGRVGYCGRACQVADWKARHKHECKGKNTAKSPSVEVR